MITSIQSGRSLTMILGLLLTFLLFSSCQREDPQPLPTAQEILDQSIELVNKDQLAADLAVIDDSLAVWGLTDEVLIEPNGVRYIIDTLGSGNQPALENRIQINYSGRLLSNGQEFDAGNEVTFFLFQLIIGFQTVLPEIPVGSSVTLYIPSGYGYGPNAFRDQAGNVVIPGNSNLIFDIDLLEIR